MARGTQARIGIANGKKRFEVAARIVHAEKGGMRIAFIQPIPQPQLKLLDHWLTQWQKSIDLPIARERLASDVICSA